MNRWCLVLLVTAIAGCSREDPRAVTAAVETAPASDRQVTLSPKAQKEAGVAVAAVEERSLPRTIQATGRITVNENRTWRVGAITEGRIIRVYANAGDRVRQGQVLARIHSHDIHESRADYRKAVAEVARLEGVESYARRARDRARRMFELKAASLQQVEQAETELSNAQTALANAKVEVERARKHLVDFLEIPIEEPKEHKAGYAESDEDLIPIKSPAAGTVLARHVTPGTVVTASGDVFVVSDLSTLWMIALVSEEHLSKLRAGMPVLVFVQAFEGRPFRGSIARLGEELDPTTRTIEVRVDVPNPQGLLKPEMYATAGIELGRTEPAIFVPQAAIQEINGRSAVFVRQAEDRFEVRPVETGHTVEGAAQIVSGLRAGELVAVQGSYILKSELLKATLAEE